MMKKKECSPLLMRSLTKKLRSLSISTIEFTPVSDGGMILYRINFQRIVPLKIYLEENKDFLIDGDQIYLSLPIVIFLRAALENLLIEDSSKFIETLRNILRNWRSSCRCMTVLTSRFL